MARYALKTLNAPIGISEFQLINLIRKKINLGCTWANKAGEMYRYFMVFDKIQMDEALNVTGLIDRLKEM